MLELQRGPSGLWTIDSLGQLNIRVLDDLGPMGNISPDSIAEFGGRAAHRYGSDLFERDPDFRLSENPVDGLVELRRDLRRRSMLGRKADPVGSDETRKTFFDHRRNILEGSDPGWGRHGESVQFASQDEVNDRKRRDKHILNVAADQIADRLRKLLVRHVRGANPCLQGEHLAYQV